MSYYHNDEKGYVKDKYGNFKNSSEVDKAVNLGDLKRFANGKFVYDPKTGKEYWADGTKRK